MPFGITRDGLHLAIRVPLEPLYRAEHEQTAVELDYLKHGSCECWELLGLLCNLSVTFEDIKTRLCDYHRTYYEKRTGEKKDHRCVTGFCSQLQEPGASATLHRISKNGLSPFRGQSTTPSSMVVVSRFSDFNFERYSTLQHLATFCNICNNFEIWHTGVSRPFELISGDGNTLFLVVSMISAFKLLCSWVSFRAICNVLHPDSYRTNLFCEAGLCLSTYSLHCLGKVWAV